MADKSGNSEQHPVDTNNEDPTYWDKLLQKMHLGMGRGKRDWLSYRGNLQKTLEAEEAKASGKVVPPGQKPVT